jgi:hypothetical protein
MLQAAPVNGWLVGSTDKQPMSLIAMARILLVSLIAMARILQPCNAINNTTMKWLLLLPLLSLLLLHLSAVSLCFLAMIDYCFCCSRFQVFSFQSVSFTVNCQ